MSHAPDLFDVPSKEVQEVPWAVLKPMTQRATARALDAAREHLQEIENARLTLKIVIQTREKAGHPGKLLRSAMRELERLSFQVGAEMEQLREWEREGAK